MKIKIEQDYYDTGKKLYPFRLLNLNPGITVLIGCNGSGKSTLLHQIDIYCKRNNITRVLYDNFRHGGYNATDELLFRGDMSSLILDVTSSEGERIYYNTARIAPKIKYSLERVKAGEPFFLLMDGLDSGMDVASIENTKMKFLKAVKEDCEKKGIIPYIVVSANSYETARDEQCFSLLTGKYVQIKTYEKYKNIVKKHMKGKWKGIGMNDNIFFSTYEKSQEINKKSAMMLEPDEKLEPAKSSQPSEKIINTYVSTLPYPREGKIIDSKRYFDTQSTKFNVVTIKNIQENLINKAKFLAYRQGYDAVINTKIDVFALTGNQYEVALSCEFVKVV